METRAMTAAEPPGSEPESPVEAPRRPLSELLPKEGRAVATGAVALILLVASFGAYGFTGHALLGAVLCPALVVLAVIDYEHHLLPNDIIFPVVLAVGLIVAAADPGHFLVHLAWGAGLAGFFLFFVIVTKGGLGMGDAKLGFLIGLALGWKTASATLVALAGLLIAALVILAKHGMGARRTAIPFGPFLALGGILAYFIG
jgi:prepilin signal peptidase PulO-like enzyme (type II secretory pathway)